jgi:hypothetical protein
MWSWNATILDGTDSKVQDWWKQSKTLSSKIRVSKGLPPKPPKAADAYISWLW